MELFRTAPARTSPSPVFPRHLRVPEATGRLVPQISRLEVERFRMIFSQQAGHPVTDFDAAWAALQARARRAARGQQWGLYRTARLDMGALLEAEDRCSEALGKYFEATYLDLNGKKDTSPAALDVSPPFNPESIEARPDPLVLARMHDLIESLQLRESQVKERFLMVAANVQQSCGAPVAPEAAWTRLENFLYEG